MKQRAPYRDPSTQCYCCHPGLLEQWLNTQDISVRQLFGNSNSRPKMDARIRGILWPHDGRLSDESLAQLFCESPSKTRHAIAPYAFQPDGRPFADHLKLEGLVRERGLVPSRSRMPAAAREPDIRHLPIAASTSAAPVLPDNEPPLPDNEPLLPGENICECCGRSYKDVDIDGEWKRIELPNRRRRPGWRTDRR